MTYILIWLLRLCVVAVVGYFISKLFNDASTGRQTARLEKNFQKELITNAYDHLNPDVDSIKKVKGLKIQRQTGLPYQKPQFYFGIDRNTRKDDIYVFLQTIPAGFEVSIPALTISIEDSKPKNIIFWKEADRFQLAFNQGNETYKYLTSIGLNELTDKIFLQSSDYSFQNIKVERLIIRE